MKVVSLYGCIGTLKELLGPTLILKKTQNKVTLKTQIEQYLKKQKLLVYMQKPQHCF